MCWPLQHKIVATFQSPFLVPSILACLITFGIDLLAVPSTRLIEQSVCTRYYRSSGANHMSGGFDPPESTCKVPKVQDLLALIVGWKKSLDAIPGTCIYKRFPFLRGY